MALCGADGGAPWVPQPQDPGLMAQQMYAVAHAAQMAAVLPPEGNLDVPPVPVPAKHGEVSDAADMLLALSGTHQQDGTVDPNVMEVKPQIPAPDGSPQIPQELGPPQPVAPQAQIPPPVRHPHTNHMRRPCSCRTTSEHLENEPICVYSRLRWSGLQIYVLVACCVWCPQLNGSGST